MKSLRLSSWGRVGAFLLLSIGASTCLFAQESPPADPPQREAKVETSASERTELLRAITLLHRAGDSCYSLANGLFGDRTKVAGTSEMVEEYLRVQRSSVSVCEVACSEAAEAAASAPAIEGDDRALLSRYGTAVAGLCKVAVAAADSVQAYGKRASAAAYEVALIESEIERRAGVLLEEKKAKEAEEAEDLVRAEEAGAEETAATPASETVPAVATAKITAPTSPSEPKAAAPAPKRPTGGSPAPYWDEERKRELLQESQRAEENRKIQEERDRLRREKRERLEAERRQAALRAMQTWHGQYQAGSKDLLVELAEVRAILEGKLKAPLVDACRALENAAQTAINDDAIFTCPILEVNSLTSTAFRGYRSLATDCIQGRTYKLVSTMQEADDRLRRVDELIEPYGLGD